jgi:hypothetical protein
MCSATTKAGGQDLYVSTNAASGFTLRAINRR